MFIVASLPYFDVKKGEIIHAPFFFYSCTLDTVSVSSDNENESLRSQCHRVPKFGTDKGYCGSLLYPRGWLLEGWFETLWFDLSVLILDGTVNKNCRLPLEFLYNVSPCSGTSRFRKYTSQISMSNISFHVRRKVGYGAGLSMSPAYSSILRITVFKTVSCISLPIPIKSNSFLDRISAAALCTVSSKSLVCW